MKVADDEVSVPVQPPIDVPPFVPLNELVSPDWIKVPLLTTLRHIRQNNSYYNYHSSKYASKEYIPRLLWLHLDWTLQQVHQHIFTLYAFILDVEQG
jgi:hypothetical protein